jgi:hypothetical protein
MYRSNGGPKYVPKLVTFVVNCVVHDRTPSDTFTDSIIFCSSGVRIVH